VSTYQSDPQTLDRLWHPAELSRLEEILFASRTSNARIPDRVDTRMA
jgi:hypothetical protein